MIIDFRVGSWWHGEWIIDFRVGSWWHGELVIDLVED